MSKFLSFCALGLLLCGCGSLIPQPGEPTKKYVLTSLPTPTYGPGVPVSSRQLVVDLPTLYPPIDNTRIALKPQEQVIDYYADVEWADRLGSLIQESLIYSFQNKGLLRSVSRPAESIHANYLLKTEVRKFYIDQSSSFTAPKAQVDYMVHLIKLPERHVVAFKNFTSSHPVKENTLEDITKSLDAAHLEASKEIVSWTAERLK
ncbi:MAG: hypothetical protein FJX71_04605 [Alphaproteobacteria bacterium]|nr:hypothetical protein [Alphaproteobacteria bacterium]